MSLPRVSPALLLLLLLLLLGSAAAWMPRDVIVTGGKFVNRKTGAVEVMNGTNVIMKGPPWIPAVNGDAACPPQGGPVRGAPCSTFNEHDVAVLKGKSWTPAGYNGQASIIRLGVIWAGGQPTPAAALDPKFVARLHAFLSLCEQHSIRVILDVHQDAVGTAQCGEGVPMWYTKQHFAHRIGKPILGPKSSMKGNCSELDTKSWALHAGDPNYNLLNPCCLRWNAPGGWGSNIEVTDFAELQIEQLVGTAVGRQAYATYIGLLAEAVSEHPAAIGVELMNEPPTIDRANLYKMFEQCYDAVRKVAPDLAVGVADTGNDPAYSDDALLPAATREWLRKATHLFYAYHCYGTACGLPSPKTPADAVANVVKLTKAWGAAAFCTEFGTSGIAEASAAAGIGWTQYQYNGFCNVPCGQGQNTCPDANKTCIPGTPCAFGACIT
jgi:hypothetical protein